MNRREALKNIGLSAGYIATTPTIISLLQSCQKEITLDWTPELLSIDQGKALEKIVDLIIPETDTPGAKSLHIPMFIDKYVNNVFEKEKTQIFSHGMLTIFKELGISDEKTIDDVAITEYDTLLSKYLRLPREKQREHKKEMASVKSVNDLKTISQESIAFNFLSSVRSLSIFGFRTSEEIAKNVLNYLPVPGEYVGCDSVQNLTGGKDWAL